MSLISRLKINKNKALLNAFSYAFSGFSIIVIGYILVNILLNYPTKKDRNFSVTKNLLCLIYILNRMTESY